MAVAAGAIVASGERHRRVASPSQPAPLTLGSSTQGRSIAAFELGDPNAARKLLIVGCIHGDERAGIAIARALETLPAPAGVDLWVVENLNPDGAAANTRQNAHGVDLNRNFPFRWRRMGRRGDQQYPGRRALSEPESRIAQRLILRLRPAITIWFHQPLGVVDKSGGDVRVERRFARLTHLPLRRLTRYPGSAAGWQNHRVKGSTAFVVELHRGSLSVARAERYAKAVDALAG
ncbi:MAG TPA: DUF2817 domain-containing protein [Solirubrobacteraceae bacterium]|nr:DUF2817 domain-containing protein [Solirubrobacteraceae bacterium]